MSQQPHRRYNPLTGSWVLVSPHRTARPWQGQTEDAPAPAAEYLADCYLCPGNARAGGVKNPDYDGVFVFENDFPALLSELQPEAASTHHLFQEQPVAGTCRVLCYHPRHDFTMATMSVSQIEAVVAAWVDQYGELAKRYRWVQIFENRGAAMGCSNPHPHGQIWALDSLPTEAQRELDQQQAYFAEHASPLLLDYANTEVELGQRTLIENNNWLVVVPYWAVWPFETLLLPKQTIQSFSELNQEAQHDLADALHQLCAGYDRLFNTPFPYSMGWHNVPSGSAGVGWQLHGHFYPPLLRSASVKKFMVGFEMLAEAQRDLTPEAACEALRAVV